MISLERRLFCLWIFYKYMQRKIGQNRKEWYDYMKRLIYLDHAATTQPFPEVLDAMIPYYSRYYGNPSSGYELGEESKRAIETARGQIADTLGVEDDTIYFTSGGTESDNWALRYAVQNGKRRRPHIVTSSIEHHVILNTCKNLEKQGVRVTYLPVDAYGRVKLDALQEALCPETILVSIMYVNNEVGSVQPIQEAASIVKAYNKDILFHVDAVQGFGKYRIYPKKLKVDMLSVSGHKIHGPKGVGFLYIDEHVKIRPIIYGGGQQKNMRSGTDNVPGIAGLGVAAAQIYENLDENVEHMYQLKEHIAEGLSEIEDIRINGMPLREGAPQILSISVMGVRSEVLLHALEDKGIYISAGSACSSHKRKPSATLSAMGMSKDQIESTVRLSFCEENTMEEADYFLQTMKELVPMLRRYSRK